MSAMNSVSGTLPAPGNIESLMLASFAYWGSVSLSGSIPDLPSLRVLAIVGDAISGTLPSMPDGLRNLVCIFSAFDLFNPRPISGTLPKFGLVNLPAGLVSVPPLAAMYINFWIAVEYLHQWKHSFWK